jgi:hypothetical protein
MGKIRIDVMFGNQDNCRVENLMFEVVDLDSPYHELLGRLTLAKFMASTHVAYLKMKMPGPRGVITMVITSAQWRVPRPDLIWPRL